MVSADKAVPLAFFSNEARQELMSTRRHDQSRLVMVVKADRNKCFKDMLALGLQRRTFQVRLCDSLARNRSHLLEAKLRVTFVYVED